MTYFRKILYITPSRIGDAILTTGVIDFFLKPATDQQVTIATPKLTHELFTEIPNLKQIFIWEKKTWKKHWVDLYGFAIKNGPWDLILDLRGSIVTYLIPNFNQSKRFIWQKTNFHNLHKVEEISKIFKNFCYKNNIKYGSKQFNPTLWFNDNTIKKIQGFLDTGNKKSKIISIAPTANWFGKEWPLENFIWVCNQLINKFPDIRIALISSEYERSKILPLLKVIPLTNLIDLTDNKHCLLDKAAFIKCSNLFIGNDSGLMHISAAVNTPTIGLFGPTNEKKCGPWLNSTLNKKNSETLVKHQVIRADSLENIKRQNNFSYDSRNISYMQSIKKEEVLKAINYSLSL